MKRGALKGVEIVNGQVCYPPKYAATIDEAVNDVREAMKEIGAARVTLTVYADYGFDMTVKA